MNLINGISNDESPTTGKDKRAALEKELINLTYITRRALHRLHCCTEDKDLGKYLPFFLASMGHAMCRLANSIQEGKRLFSSQFNEFQRGWRPDEEETRPNS
jgi:hypothetical protein